MRRADGVIPGGGCGVGAHDREVSGQHDLGAATEGEGLHVRGPSTGVHSNRKAMSPDTGTWIKPQVLDQIQRILEVATY
jgi:hypothetical protein